MTTRPSWQAYAPWIAIILTLVSLLGSFAAYIQYRFSEIAALSYEHSKDGHPHYVRERITAYRDETNRRLDRLERDVDRLIRSQWSYESGDE